ncbi:transglutaminase-like domain-containing protein [Sphingomonas sp. LB-2]|uniref:transglutaminase-like domain-containing protein n=1 Tax=Sphingomonas caeni TaxID=2984949 RepID=UPI002231D288|nr:transglutaminase-like domain-containing protein [Sphingomonas caeni]MCW3846116.1 transglutaminase-like domain-containing protein [Sphingomonas caeni]
MLVRAFLCLAIAVLAGPATAQVAPAPATNWFRVLTEYGTQIGHRSQQVTQSAEGRETVSLQELLLQEPGDPVSRAASQTVVTEDSTGRVIAISDYSQTGRSWTRTTAKIEPGRAIITRATKSDTHTTTIPLPPGTRFDAGAGLLRNWDGKTILEFRNFSLDAQAVERMTIEPAPGGAIRKRYDGDQLRGAARLELGTDGRVTAMIQPMFGSRIAIVPATREEALAGHPPFRMFATVMIKSPVRIAEPAAQGHIRYRFGFRDGIVFTPPETGEQRVTMAGGEATVDICDSCGPGLPTDPAFLADARRATPWLQIDHPRIRAITGRTARLKIGDARKMELLTAEAIGHLGKIDFTGHYSALETLERGAGDCTEAAVLLAAFGRAVGIPTKVVNGLVYSRERYHGVSNAFMPHSWVLAFVGGKWRSYDAALSTFDSTHIALSIGDGDARSLTAAGQLGSLLTWQSMAEVRTR